jgi:UDP-3-O-[3-hydroxymyristoyl] glucosamine N-acyltransferase
VGEGAYLSNKATIGTNLALKDGRIMVEGITLGKRAMIGHLTMVAAGTVVGDDGEISHGTACGARVELGRGACAKPDCGIDHKSRIGDEAEIGTRSYVGLAAVIGPGVKVPPGANLPQRAKIRTQEDMDQYISSETKDLHELRRQLAHLIDGTK